MADDSRVSRQLTENLRSKLEKIAADHGFVKPLFNLGEGSKHGENFIGDVFRVVIEEQDASSGQESLPLVVKGIPDLSLTAHIFSVEIFFRMESLFYDLIQPVFLALQREHGITQNFAPLSPHCYDAAEEIILEDMRPQGFQMKPDYVVDLPHCLIFLKEIGRFHALSLALKHQNPEQYRNITRNLEESFLVEHPSELLLGRFDAAVEMAVEEFKGRTTLEEKERYVRVFERFADGYYEKVKKLIRSETAEPYAVLNHGDCWTNNALFKYEEGDEKKLPQGVCLLDFQLMRNSSPALDVAYFIFICTTKELRAAHYKKMLDAYYDSLAAFLKQLGSDPAEVFPRTAFQDQMKRFAQYALSMVIHELPLYTFNAADEPATADDVAEPEDNPAYTLTHANMDRCWDLIIDVFVDLMDLGYDID